MLIFIVRFFRSMKVDEVSTGSYTLTIAELAPLLQACLYWQIALYLLLIIY